MVGNHGDSRYGHLNKEEILGLIEKYQKTRKFLQETNKKGVKVTDRRLRQLHEELRRKN